MEMNLDLFIISTSSNFQRYDVSFTIIEVHGIMWHHLNPIAKDMVHSKV